MTEKKIFKWSAIVLFLVMVLAYSNHFENDFHFDDYHTIVINPNIRKLSNIPRFFVDPSMFSASPNHHMLRPLVTTSLAIDYWLGGGFTLFFFQFSTFIWHIFLCVFLFLAYRKILSVFSSHRWVPFVALFATAWFGIHTAGAETLNYIISRSDVLSTFFIVLSFYLFITYPQKRKKLLYLIPAAIGILAKETVPVLLILLFFYIILFEKNRSVGDIFKKGGRQLILQTLKQMIPAFVVIILVQLYIVSAMQKSTVSYGMSSPLIYYWLTQTYVWLLYFKTFFLPTHLTADTDLTVITNAADPRILAGLLFVSLLVYTIFRTSQKPKNRPVAFGLIWFAASLLPTSVAPFAEVMNDHRMYFAFTGLALAVVAALGNFVISREKPIMANRQWRLMVPVLICMVIALNAFGVYQRNKVWKTNESLWYDVTQKSPNNGRGLMNYGLALASKGQYGRALEYFLKALKLNPDYNILYVNLGMASGKLNRHEDAEKYFKTAIALDSTYAEAYSYYAQYLLEKADMKGAQLNAQKALSLNASDIVASRVFMTTLQAAGNWQELQQTAQQTLERIPGDENAKQFLIISQNRTPYDSTAINFVQRPKTADDFVNRSLVMYQLGNFEECIASCQEALKLNPESAIAYSNMCAAYNSLKQWDKAKEACENALRIDPDNEMAKGNLNWAIQQKK